MAAFGQFAAGLFFGFASSGSDSKPGFSSGGCSGS
jgi:hypothetical protein